MLLESKKPLFARYSSLWGRTLAGSLVALGLLAGGVGLRVVAAEDKKKEEPTREAPGKEAPPKEAPKDPPAAPRKRVPIPVPVDPERLLENFGGLGLDEDAARELRQRMDEVRRQMEEMRKQMQQQGFRGGLGGGFGGGFGGLGGGIMGGGLAVPGDPFGPLSTAKPRQPRLGAQVRVPSQTLIDQLELPRDQGLVLEEVGPNSAAGKAGLKSHDILLELDGKPVSNKVDEFLKQLEGVQANKPVDVVVLRKGKKETVKGLNLPEVKAEERPAFNPPRAGRLSAPLLGGNNRNAMTTFNRTNDDFTVRHRDNGLSIQLRGTINQGNAQVTEIVIEDEGGKKTTYTSVDKVPAEYRARVQKLAEMSAKGNIRVPFE